MLPFDSMDAEQRAWFVERAERVIADGWSKTDETDEEQEADRPAPAHTAFTVAESPQAMRKAGLAIGRALGFPPPYVPIIKGKK